MKKGRSYITISILCFLIVLTWGYLEYQNRQITHGITTLEGAWFFSLNDTVTENQPGENLAAFIFPHISKGDVAVFERKFLEKDKENQIIAFDTWHMLTKVFLEEELLYSWGEEYNEKGQMLGAARHNISLPDTFYGKTLRIELTATEDKPMPYLTSVGYFEGSNENAFWFNRPITLLLIGIFFVFLGVVIHFISTIFVIKGKQFLEPLSLGMSIILTGIYILSRGFFLQLLINDPQVYNAVEYGSLFLIPVPLLSYWFFDAKECKVQFARIFYYVILSLTILFAIGTLILNFTTSIHLCQVLTFYYLLVLGVAVSIGLLIRFRDKETGVLRRKIYLFGICAFILGAILSIIAFSLCYNPFVAGLLRLWQWYNYILPFSMCVLVLFFIMAFYLEVKQILNNSYQSEFLNYVAYYDALTQLHNRRSFEEDMEKLQSVSAYGIISIDLNGLKQINDTLGHLTGDTMLKDFGELFLKCCGNNVRAYRIGGDEFAAIVVGEGEAYCGELVAKINREIEICNLRQNTYSLSAACGIALSREGEKAADILELADQRMYENKRAMKEENHGEVFNYRRV